MSSFISVKWGGGWVHLAEEQTEAQTRGRIHPGSQSWRVGRPGFEPGTCPQSPIPRLRGSPDWVYDSCLQSAAKSLTEGVGWPTRQLSLVSVCPLWGHASAVKITLSASEKPSERQPACPPPRRRQSPQRSRRGDLSGKRCSVNWILEGSWANGRPLIAVWGCTCVGS